MGPEQLAVGLPLLLALRNPKKPTDERKRSEFYLLDGMVVAARKLFVARFSSSRVDSQLWSAQIMTSCGGFDSVTTLGLWTLRVRARC